MQRRQFLGSVALAASASRAAVEPEKKSSAEPLDLQHKIDDTLSGRRPYEPLAYPYFSPDYKLPFTHIGTEKQLFLNNFMLEHLEGVERAIAVPEKHPRPLIRNTNLPWEHEFSGGVAAAMFDRDDRKFKMWYSQSLSGDLCSTGQVLCYAESTDALNWEKPSANAAFRTEQQATDRGRRRRFRSRTGCEPPTIKSEPQIPARVSGARLSKHVRFRVLFRVAASAEGLRFQL